jgi:pimeloyl-ACP methyl ester carboxylesterase
MPKSSKPRQLRLQRDGLELSAQLHGPDHAPLVMLVHGFPDTPHSWSGVLPPLLAAGYQVLVPWLRGYTAESVDRSQAYGLLSATGDLQAWHESLGSPPLHLVGHDWGAVLAMTWAGLDDSALSTVSLLAIPPVPGPSHLWPVVKTLPQQLRLSSYMALMQSEWAPALICRNNAEYVRNLWKRWSPGWAFTEEQFEPTRQVFSDPLNAWAATRYYRALFTLNKPDTRLALQCLMTPLKVPTLALAGLNDGCMGIEFHKALLQTSAFSGGLTVAHLADCGHFLQAEKPQEVASALLSHFANHCHKATY